jgi:hypothetical protein
MEPSTPRPTPQQQVNFDSSHDATSQSSIHNSLHASEMFMPFSKQTNKQTNKQTLFIISNVSTLDLSKRTPHSFGPAVKLTKQDLPVDVIHTQLVPVDTLDDLV